jgi:hypothetical protein
MAASHTTTMRTESLSINKKWSSHALVADLIGHMMFWGTDKVFILINFIGITVPKCIHNCPSLL